MIVMRIEDKEFRMQMQSFAKKADLSFSRAVIRATFEMKKMAMLKVRDMTRNSKVKSSYLLNNIRERITNKGMTGEVISAANYSQAYEEGTRPHIIRVKNKGVLAGPLRGAPQGWAVSAKSREMGYATYGKQVQHPGTSPHPFMFPAWKFACQKLEEFIRQAL